MEKITSDIELKVPVEVYSRVCGYFRPVRQWNNGKREEFLERKVPSFDSFIYKVGSVG